MTPGPSNAPRYVDIIKDKTLLRRIAETMGDVTAMIQDGSSGQEVLDEAETRIYGIRQGRSVRGLEHISTVILFLVYDRLNVLAESGRAVPDCPPAWWTWTGPSPA